MNIGDIIKNRRLELGLTLEKVGMAVGVGKSTVRKWESGQIKDMRRDKIAALADVLRIPPAALILEDADAFKPQPPTVTEDIVELPVIGDLAAGYDRIACEHWTGETVSVPASYLKGRNKNDFIVLCVKGDSMYPMYQNDDKVLILKQDCVPRSGAVGAIIYKDELSTLKKVEYGEGWVRLLPVNPMYTPIEITGEDLAHFKVIGVPRLLIREIEE